MWSAETRLPGETNTTLPRASIRSTSLKTSASSANNWMSLQSMWTFLSRIVWVGRMLLRSWRTADQVVHPPGTGAPCACAGIAAAIKTSRKKMPVRNITGGRSAKNITVQAASDRPNQEDRPGHDDGVAVRARGGDGCHRIVHDRG